MNTNMTYGATVSIVASSTSPAKMLPNSRKESERDRKSTRLNSSHLVISYAVFCLKKKNKHIHVSLAYPILLRDVLFIIHTRSWTLLCSTPVDTITPQYCLSFSLLYSHVRCILSSA